MADVPAPATSPLLQPGDVVVVRDETWAVARVERFEHCTILALDGRGPDNRGRRFHAIAPFDRVSAPPNTLPRCRRRRTVLRRALDAIADEQPALGLWTAAAAHLDLFGYQLEPALAVLHGATRVLLADAVGLGKTIQAGLILSELRARGLVERALILCPAGLRETWAGELRDRFGIAATTLDQTALAFGQQDLPSHVNPWSAHRVVIASIDFIKRAEVLAAAEGVLFDLVIADEAHHLTPDSDRAHAVHRLALRAPWVVLVSATPHSGDPQAFDFMTAIGAIDDRLAMFRRRRSDIGRLEHRRTRMVAVGPTADESRLLDAIDAYTRAIWHGRGQTDHAVQLVAITLARRAASSATAVGRTLERRRALLSGTETTAPAQARLPWDDVDDADWDQRRQELARPGLDDEDGERQRLDALIDLARQAATASSKLVRVQRLLTRAGEPAVVFTEYRDTLEAAAAQLTPAFRLGVIHGGVPAPVRQDIVRQFNGGSIDVLLATDTAGEGLNLHRRCRLVIDLELPWNPRRLEQRVGRVDRLGQERRVHALHLIHRGTVEDRVWQHLERRRQRATEDLAGWDAPTAEDVARAVFGDGAPPRPAASAPIATQVAGAEDELRRLVSQRRWRAGTGLAPSGTVFARPRRLGRRAGVAALFEVTQTGPGGGLIERRVHACLVDLRGAHTPAAWRDVAAALQYYDGANHSAAHLQPTRRNVLARIGAARTRLAIRAPLHQASLFERRAEQAAGTRRELAARLDQALARRADSVSVTDFCPVHSRLVALWPLTTTP